VEIVEPQIGVKIVPGIEAIPPPEIIAPPILQSIDMRLPVFEMPCAMTRESSIGTSSDLFVSDKSQNLVICTGGAPAFFAPQLKVGGTVKPELKVSDYVQENETAQKKTEQPQVDIPRIQPRTPCPPPGSLPIGSVGKYGRGRVTGYRLDTFSGKCVTEYEPIKIFETVDHFTPPPALVTGVMVTALFGASAALAAAPLTEVIKKKSKPLQKKIVKFVKKKLGKKEKLLSRSERMREQREKKATDRMWRSLGKK
jgi:hypothetical protein